MPRPLDALIARAYGQRPDLHALQARRDAAQAVLSLAQAQRKPWFRVLFTGGWARFNPLQLSNLTALGVGLSMPLLTFGATEGAVEEAEALLDRAERRLEEAQQLAALETRLAFYAFRAAREKLPLAERQAELSGEAARLARAPLPRAVGKPGRACPSGKQPCGRASRRARRALRSAEDACGVAPRHRRNACGRKRRAVKPRLRPASSDTLRP